MRAAVVGAGLSGLAAARTLTEAGHEAVVFEKSADPGGRVVTTRVGPYAFDMGATSIAPRGRALEQVMLNGGDGRLVKLDKPIYAHHGLRVEAGDSGKSKVPRFAYAGGNDWLPISLAESLNVRYLTPASELSASSASAEVNGEKFDAVIITLPAPESAAFLNGFPARHALGRVTYRSCISIGLGFEAPTPQVPYHALIEPEQRHPLTWLSLESGKAPGHAPEGCSAIVAQMSPEFSRLHFDDLDPAIIAAALEYIVRLYGQAFANPAAAHISRWVNSLPENLAMFDSVNSGAERVFVAGDGLVGGRTELAYDSGVQAARRLLECL